MYWLCCLVEGECAVVLVQYSKYNKSLDPRTPELPAITMWAERKAGRIFISALFDTFDTSVLEERGKDCRLSHRERQGLD